MYIKRCSLHSGNSKGVRSLVPGTGDRDRIYTFYNTADTKAFVAGIDNTEGAEDAHLGP